MIEGIITARQAQVFLAPRPNQELYDLINDPNQINNLMLGKEIPAVHQELKLILKQWSNATGDDLPVNITKDWYLREPVGSTEKGTDGKQKSNRAKDDRIRGEMPGTLGNATKINAKGPL